MRNPHRFLPVRKGKQHHGELSTALVSAETSSDAELQVAEFYTDLKRRVPYAFVTPILVLVNVGVFVAMLVGGVDLTFPSIEHLLSWGGELCANDDRR